MCFAFGAEVSCVNSEPVVWHSVGQHSSQAEGQLVKVVHRASFLTATAHTSASVELIFKPAAALPVKLSCTSRHAQL